MMMLPRHEVSGLYDLGRFTELLGWPSVEHTRAAS
jgi:hypothetical protein